MIVIRHSYISVLSKRRAAGSLSAARTLAIGAALGHVKYIQHRPGQDRADGSRDFFNELEDNLDSDELRNAIREYRGNRVVVHKLTIAPEINPADTETFTREVMHQLGDKKGLDLQWWAVTHRNTDNHHVHVVVLSKDKYGRQVRFDRSDYQLMKQHGDRYLDRVHTYEFREAQRAREEKERQQTKERRQERESDRQERIQRGEELPGLHKKIVTEQLTPYKETQEKLPRLTRKNADKTPPSVGYQGERYSRNDSRERLSGLIRRVHDNQDKKLRLPKENYQQLRNWIDQKDRARFAGEIDRQLSAAKTRQTNQDQAKTSPAANRWVSPMQAELLRNPIIGLFLTEAAIASEIVRSIPLTDRRDRLKEAREDLESAKRDTESRQRHRKTPDKKVCDEETIQKIDEAIEDNKNTRKDARKEREKEKRKRDRDLDQMR